MPAPPRILLVDDDASLLDVLGMALEDAGFAVRTAPDGEAGWRAFSAAEPDLVVTDLLMPRLDGLELCRRIRAAHATPVVMLTSRDEEMDKVLGLELGADDYVTKPFSTRELIARIRAALRRVRLDAPATGAVLEHGPLRLDRDRREAGLGGTELSLTVTEFDLLWTLSERPGHVFRRNDLVDLVWGPDVIVGARTVDTFVKRLRRKLHDADPAFEGIETVRGVGYRFAT